MPPITKSSDIKTVCKKKYSVDRKIGSGSFGEIYIGTNKVSGEKVAIKMENINSKTQQLTTEIKMYQRLNGGKGIPKLRYGSPEQGYNIMVMDLLGPSLGDLQKKCGGRFNLKTVLMIAEQLIDRLQQCHEKNIIHRDIKPENFCIGVGGQAHVCHIIDFGMAKYYRRNEKHLPYREFVSFAGTPRYTSIGTHIGIEQSRRDDLEALAYVLIYLRLGELPWKGFKDINKKEKYERIMKSKMSVPIKKLCRQLPKSFQLYLEYCRSLKFEDTPNYDYMKGLFSEQFQQEGYQRDLVYDWTER